MKKITLLILALIVILLATLLAGCQNSTQVCPPVTGTPQYLTALPADLATPAPDSGATSVEIGRKKILVDKVIEGPLCNDTWKGIVYVSCNVQVYPWDEQPSFLKNCQLNIEPNTVVYVASHNNTAYYNGCSCHTGETPEP